MATDATFSLSYAPPERLCVSPEWRERGGVENRVQSRKSTRYCVSLVHVCWAFSAHAISFPTPPPPPHTPHPGNSTRSSYNRDFTKTSLSLRCRALKLAVPVELCLPLFSDFFRKQILTGVLTWVGRPLTPHPCGFFSFLLPSQNHIPLLLPQPTGQRRNSPRGNWGCSLISRVTRSHGRVSFRSLMQLSAAHSPNVTSPRVRTWPHSSRCSKVELQGAWDAVY